MLERQENVYVFHALPVALRPMRELLFLRRNILFRLATTARHYFAFVDEIFIFAENDLGTASMILFFRVLFRCRRFDRNVSMAAVWSINRIIK